jgi:hypothetical protein
MSLQRVTGMLRDRAAGAVAAIVHVPPAARSAFDHACLELFLAQHRGYQVADLTADGRADG